MKAIIKTMMLATILTSVSCSDYLDKTPDEDMTLDMVFTNQEWTDQFLIFFRLKA